MAAVGAAGRTAGPPGRCRAAPDSSHGSYARSQSATQPGLHHCARPRPGRHAARNALAPAAKAKPAARRNANAIEALGKPLVFIAALLGALALAWLALHLLSQGLLPAPKHPAGVSRSAPTRPPLKP